MLKISFNFLLKYFKRRRISHILAELFSMTRHWTRRNPFISAEEGYPGIRRTGWWWTGGRRWRMPIMKIAWGNGNAPASHQYPLASGQPPARSFPHCHALPQEFPVGYTAPGGVEMKIDLGLKRTYEIEGGKLVDFFDRLCCLSPHPFPYSGCGIYFPPSPHTAAV